MSVDIKELQELIEQEKSAEQKIRAAKQEAQNVVQVAREKAESVIQEVDSGPHWEEMKRTRKEQITRGKAELDEEHKRKIALLEKAAQRNFEKAVASVAKEILRVET
jgi:vacuolar-type H+-ATPase subunit H